MSRLSRDGKVRWPLVGALLLTALLGLALVAAAIGLAHQMLTYHRLDQEISGTVVSQDRREEGCSSTVSYTVDLVDHETGFMSCPGVGTVVTVKYAADDPGGGTADGAGRVYAVNPILIVCFLGVAGLCWVVGYREWRKQETGETESLFDPEEPA